MSCEKKPVTQVANDNIWDSYYRSYQDGSKVPGVRYPNEHLVRFIADWRKSNAWPASGRPRVLEFGFGTVTNMAMMSRFGCDVEGLEVSANTTERTREAIDDFGMAGSLSVDTYEGGAVVPKPDGRYDAIVGLQCVYYNLDQVAFASECARMLKPGGLLFLSFFSPRHGYMQHIEGEPGGPVRFKEGHPNPRLVGLNPFLYQNEAQYEQTYGQHFDIRVGVDEFDLLPVHQSWYYLRGQKNDAPAEMKVEFPLSIASAGPDPALQPDTRGAQDLLKENIAIWSGFTASIPDEEPFSGQRYPDEQMVRFLATWKRRKRDDYFVASIGGEEDDACVSDMNALEINPLNPVHLEAMKGFGYCPLGVSYMPAAAENTRKGLERMGLNGASVKAWDGVTLPYDDASIEAVISTKAGYYQPNQRQFVTEVARVVRPEGEVFMYYLSAEHGYMDCLDHVENNIYRFNERQPNPALVGANVFVASKQALLELWSPYFDLEVKSFAFNTYSTFSAFYVVTGTRLKNS